MTRGQPGVLDLDVKLRILVATVISASRVSAPAAHADTFYGGAAVKDGRQNGPGDRARSRATDGSITGRVCFTYSAGAGR